MSQVHVIGAGLAGLAAALSLTAPGMPVVVHEAGPAAGGRCRSYFDKELGLRIDNGNHLLLSGNTAARAYIAETGAADDLSSPERSSFPFHGRPDRRALDMRPNRGPHPVVDLRAGRRVPQTRLSDYLRWRGSCVSATTRAVSDSMRRRPPLRATAGAPGGRRAEHPARRRSRPSAWRRHARDPDARRSRLHPDAAEAGPFGGTD